LNAQWFLGVPNNDPELITCTILAEELYTLPIGAVTNPPVPVTMPANSTNFLLVDVPEYADWATNLLSAATAPLNVWYSTNIPPTAGAPQDLELFTNATSGTVVFGVSNTVPPLAPGAFYYLTVQNTNPFAVTCDLTTVFHLNLPPILAPVITNLWVTNLTPTTATLAATVIPNGTNTTVWFGWWLPGAPTNFTPAVTLTNSYYSPWPVATAISGLLPGNPCDFEVIATNLVGAVTNALNGVLVTPPAPPTVTTEPATNLTPATATLQALVNPNGTNTLVSFAYGTNTSYGSYTPGTLLANSLNRGQWVTYLVSGLLPGMIYHYRAIGANVAGTNYGVDLTFTNPPERAAVLTLPATNVTAFGATLPATVTPNGAATTVSFEYGTNLSDGSFSTGKLLNSNLNSPQSVAVTVGGLLPGVLYHYQAVGVNSAGTNDGGDLTFTTPPAAPAVVTLPATNVVGNTATVAALATPNGAAATVYFEYGTTTNYGGSTSPTALVGNLDGAQVVTSVLSGLQPGVNWHYQAVAYNNIGTNYGGDLTLIPPATTASVPLTAIIATNNGYLLSWYAPTNDQFRVQWIGTLSATNWYTFANFVLYTNTNPLTVTNPTVGLFTFFDNGAQGGPFGPARFYRLFQLPPTLPPSGAVYRINPLSTLVVTNTALYSNPNSSLSYAVSGTLTGANRPVIGLNSGIITWTPTLAQAGLTNRKR
jgi:hypothetical protein